MHSWQFSISSCSSFYWDKETRIDGRVLILSGRPQTEPAEVSNLSDPEKVALHLLESSGAWSVVYHRPDLNCVFVGRDVFGRFSLLFTLIGDDILISDVAHGSDLSKWNEVPYGQICCIRLNNKSAVLYSVIPSYADGTLEPWANVFSSFSVKHIHIKDNLVTVSRATENECFNILDEFLQRLVVATKTLSPNDTEDVAIAFSGGVDSLLVAVGVHLACASEQHVDLVNVAFNRGPEHRTIATDRERAMTGFFFLRSRYPERQWRLILVDVTQAEMERDRSERVVRAAAPALSVLDESLACVLWYALRGIGTEYDSGHSTCSRARIYFVGSGADELFAGYARHRTRFERDGAGAIADECEAELRRLGQRNGGRDARVAAILSKELRAPFLQDNFVAWVNSLPMCLKCDLSLPRGEGEKRIVRQVLARFGAPHNAPKQAMQFGSGFVKMQNDKTLKGSDLSSTLLKSRVTLGI